MLIQFLIHKSRLHQRLAIIECTVYLKGGNILSESRKLFFLYFTNFPFRIKHIYMNALHAEKTISYRTSRITGGSNQHIDLSLTFFSDEVS